MKNFLIALFVVNTYALFSQSDTENYTKTISPKTALSITELEGLLGDSSVPQSLPLNNHVTPGTYLASEEVTMGFGFRATEDVTVRITGSGVADDLLETILYTDGLGRPTQSIGKAQSPDGHDIVSFSDYDEFGRESNNYLPYPTSQNNGNFIVDPVTSQTSYYQTNYGDTRSYAENRFDGSPLNRVEEAGSPGYDWRIIEGSDNDHTQKFEYETNVNTTEVRKFTVDDTGTSVVVNLDYYAANELFKNTVKNENWQPSDGLLNSIVSYSDKNGRVVAQYTYEQSGGNTLWNITQNVYDRHGRLRFVLPPPMMEIIIGAGTGFTLDSTTIEQYKDLIYQYEYDQYNRKIAQRTPNKVWEYLVYDELDRPVFVRDANMAHLSKWYCTKYDVFGRPIYTGIYQKIGHGTRELLQQAVDDHIAANPSSPHNTEKRTVGTITVGGMAMNYTNDAFPTSGLQEVLTVNYYDDYDFTDSDKPTTPTTIEGQNVTTRTRGLQTASFSKTIDGLDWTKLYTYYDDKGREIKIYNKNWEGGYTTTDSKLDFRGKIESSVTRHKKDPAATELTITDRFTYDHSERPLGHFQKINAQAEERISENKYDEMGMLVTKHVGGKSSLANALQDIDYQYNIKGQLLKINDVESLGNDLFAYELKYNEPKEGHSSWTIPQQYNGNISQAAWRSAHSDNKKSYIYDYDKLNRLRNTYYENEGLPNLNDEAYSLSLTYDRNGNIKTLQRRNSGGHNSDNLTYTYAANSNQLLRVTDPYGYYSTTGLFTNDNTVGDDYDYHYFTGALVKDLNKGINNISFNEIDLTKKIDFANGPDITFTYNASGQKLQKVSGSATTLYHGGFQYLNGDLQFFPTPEGYVKKSGNDFQHVYVYADHLGNNRVSYADLDSDGTLAISELLSSRDYDPFGGVIPDYDSIENYVDSYASGYNYLYQGKELNEEGGLNWHDFGSRNYDAALGRWVVPDPANQFASPYLAMGNNPIVYVDPDGEWIHIAIGAVVGGAINLATNWNNIDNFGEGLAAFGVGAAAGAATAACGACGSALWIAAAGGAATATTNNIISQTGNGVGLNDVQWGQVGLNAGVGAVAGLASSAASSWASNNLATPIVNGLNVKGPAVASAINGTIGGTVGGAAGGFTGGLIFSGGDLNVAFDGAVSGLKNGAVIGFGTGLGTGYTYAKINGVNPWTGRSASVGSTGLVGQRAIEDEGFIKPNRGIETSRGYRFLDGRDEFLGIGVEAKVGRVSNSKFVRNQILKDLEILQQPEINTIEWRFFKSPVTGRIGPTQGFQNFIQNNAASQNINYYYDSSTNIIRLSIN